MIINKKYIIVILVTFIVGLFLSCRDIPVKNKSRLLANDFRLYQDTPAWSLAKAVEDQDSNEIYHQVRDLHVPVDYEDCVYKGTLLEMAAYRGKETSVEALLKCGADPNHYSDTAVWYSRGGNAVISAVESGNLKVLRLVLEYHGDPNSREKGHNGHFSFSKADFSALQWCKNLDQIKLLMKYGADINDGFETKPHYGAIYGYRFNNPEIMYYYLTHGAKFYASENIDEEPELAGVNLLWTLRYMFYSMQEIKSNCKGYKYKMKIIKFLKQRGYDYYKCPIPDDEVENAKRLYPDDWEEYLKIY